mmetsp:Transcript_17101/g.15065  ORF Transcript_17101/g.15065 Transcript_17101/m.15065 type:complete len:83 (-) Transcript_17101:1768-2016(-)
MNEMYSKHRPMYIKMSMILDHFILNQLDLLKKDQEEILYFMNPEEMKDDYMINKLLKDHNSKLLALLKEEVKGIPDLIIEHA